MKTIHSLAALVAALALVPTALPLAGQLPADSFVLQGAAGYREFDTHGDDTFACDVTTTFALAAPGTGAGTGAAIYVPDTSDCSSISLSSGAYGEAVASFVVTDPRDDSMIFEWQGDHFVQSEDGTWVDDIVFSNGDNAVLSVNANGAFNQTYTFADGHGYQFLGTLAPVL